MTGSLPCASCLIERGKEPLGVIFLTVDSEVAVAQEVYSMLIDVRINHHVIGIIVRSQTFTKKQERLSSRGQFLCGLRPFRLLS